MTLWDKAKAQRVGQSAEIVNSCGKDTLRNLKTMIQIYKTTSLVSLI